MFHKPHMNEDEELCETKKANAKSSEVERENIYICTSTANKAEVLYEGMRPPIIGHIVQ